MEAGRIFDELFVRARDTDEFEYACALLRIRGLEDAGWDPLDADLNRPCRWGSASRPAYTSEAFRGSGSEGVR